MIKVYKYLNKCLKVKKNKIMKIIINTKYRVIFLFCSLNKDFKKEVSNLIKEKLNIKDDSKLIDENNIELLMKDENNRAYSSKTS